VIVSVAGFQVIINGRFWVTAEAFSPARERAEGRDYSPLSRAALCTNGLTSVRGLSMGTCRLSEIMVFDPAQARINIDRSEVQKAYNGFLVGRWLEMGTVDAQGLAFRPTKTA
jgi:hypothetical protein